ncbi:MAG: permease-like cell division protein FtsX [Actinomycetota bacterium]|nr:permease-like cell division protein FtsX [Actinomycetota bacterium]
MRASFVLSEMTTGLRRNFTMTFAAVVTVMLSLVLLGSAVLVSKQVSTMKDFWFDKVEVSVFLANDVSQDQRAQLNGDLSSNAEVKTVFYESKEDAYKRFTQQFKDSPALVKNVSADALPESFRVKLKDPTHYEVVASAFRSRPGVEEVQDQRAILQPFFKLLNVVRVVAIAVAVLMLLVALLLISNTVRVAAFSRRRETGIMRLVGASNAYIQLPFLLEGIVAGLIGAVIASALLFVGKWVFVDHVLRPVLRFTAFIGWGAVWTTVPLLVLAGVGLSGLASFVTLRRFLRV